MAPRGNENLEAFAVTVNDLDNHLPKGRGRCFDIGIWGGCGVECAAFVDGECDELGEFSIKDILAKYDEEDTIEIALKYERFTVELDELTKP